MQQNEDGDEPTRKRIRTATPLPKLQLFATHLVQLAEPITATVIYPFAPDLVKFTGITGDDETKTGYYAGAIESAFFVTECLTVYFWGRASDRHGRKPILLIGPLGLCICTIAFGLSTNFWILMFFRALQGVFNGNIGVSKTIMTEVTDSSNRAQAFTMIPVMWNSGVIIGPIIGGLLVTPADRWPDSLGKIALLRDFPYFLPCFIAASVALLSFIFALFTLKETLPKSLRKREAALGTSASESERLLPEERLCYEATSDLDDAKHGTTPPTLKEILTPRLTIVLINYGFLSFLDMSYKALLPLMYSTSIQLGGLGLDPEYIGSLLAAAGFATALGCFMLFGRLIDRFTPRRMYIAALFALLISVSAYPVLSFFAKRSGKVGANVYTVIAVQLLSSVAISPAFSSMQLIAIDSAISRSAVASINGLAQMMGTALRALAPIFSSSLFALTIEYNLMGGCFVYLLLILVVVTAIWTASLIPKPTPREAEA